jgi:tRNA threonylcarbamoyl adenosine modification protein (Sua5/YciO/YrdC/YwlC family)
MITLPLGKILEPGPRKQIADCIRGGGVLAYPTDTLYGLGGDFFSLAAHARIDALKERGGQPYSAAVGSLAMLESLTAGVPEALRLSLRRLLPGKFTFLFRPGPLIDPRLLRGSDRIGIRLPGLPPLLALIEGLGLPLVSTSANRSGGPPLNDPQEIAREFPALEIVIDGGVLPPSLGSTVVDLAVVPLRIVRQGDGILAAP